MATIDDQVKDAPKITGRRILNKYQEDDSAALDFVVGVGMVSLGMATNNTPVTIFGAGMGLLGLGVRAYSLADAYFRAKLDYMQNGRFTKLDE